ncbi:nitrate- and nitrite sensing domain-containing protein [Allokutzneria sp. NRRL B-24872]|uniref:sensor histidine kinase n=1 Tax=Allokutzneria sp. NRRL B-24872 TaxID=1137961 RepID=UPI000A3C430B|nr:nitrate- and nitrite sensing domain-containing protein [Allokutzneria sp. NRRL B-24872]
MPDQPGRIASRKGAPNRSTAPAEDGDGGGPSPRAQRRTQPVSESTPIPAHPDRRDDARWRLRNWRLRNRMAVVLLVPTITALVLGTLRVQDELARADDFQRTVAQVDVARKVTTVIHEIQKERTLVVAMVAAGRSTDRKPMVDQFETVNVAVNELNRAMEPLEYDDAASEERYKRGIQRLSALNPLRLVADTTSYADIAVHAVYSSILDALVQLGREVSASVSEHALSRAATAIQALTQAKERVAQQNALMQMAATHNEFRAGQLDELRSANSGYDAAVSDFQAVATPGERQLFLGTVSGSDVDTRQRIKQISVIKGANGDSLNIDSTEYTRVAGVTSDLLSRVENSLLESLRSEADDLAAAAVASATRDAALVLVALLAALLLMAVVVRSLLTPLRVLRTEALDVANERLPVTVRRILDDPNPAEAAKTAVQPVKVFTREEIGQVARAFDAVHEQAVHMATEQALLRDNVNAMFVNLSRRSQTLVERQLSVLDQLEQDEQDPDALSSLFVLDHLATRMRRNSENLLILSGSGLGKRLSAPVPVAELIGAAVSEVEHYARINLTSAPDVLVQGRVVNDLIHLTAELLDNATVFSDPQSPVDVSVAQLRSKDLAIQITDRGVGMSEEELAEANKNLAEPPEIDVAVSRRMGLYVVARLAARHEIKVRLHNGEYIDGGTRAIITVPAALVVLPSALDTGLYPTSQQQFPPPMPQRQPQQHLPEQQEWFTSTNPAVDPVEPEPAPAPVPAQAPAPAPAEQPVAEAVTQADAAEQPRMGGPRALARRLAPSLVEQTEGRGLEADDLMAPPVPAESTVDSTDSADASDLFAPHQDERAYQETPAPQENPVQQSGGYENPFPQVDRPEVDAPTERLPIYEEILSQWFQTVENPDGEFPNPSPPRPVPASEPAPVAKAPVERPAAERPAAPEPEPVVEPVPVAEPVVRAEPVAPPAPAPVEPVTRRETIPAPPRPSTWRSAGDEGWRAVETMLNAPAEEAVTSAGLPKRVPKAKLMPGSIKPAAPRRSAPPTRGTGTTGQQPAIAAEPAQPARSAETVRGRMSSFQQGLRRGRHARIDELAGERAGSNGTHAPNGAASPNGAARQEEDK